MVDPERSWLPPAEGWSTIQEWHGIGDAVIQDRRSNRDDKKFRPTRRGMTRHTRVAWHRGRGHTGPTIKQRWQKSQTRVSVARGTSKGQTIRKRHQAQPECNSGIKDSGERWQLCLGSKRALNKTVRHTFGLEVAKQTVELSIRLQKMSDWTLWRGRPPPERKRQQEPEI
jgi:hypothetical protein